jgi:hypothetical protein
MKDIESLSMQATDVKPVTVEGWHEAEDYEDNPSYWEAFTFERDTDEDVTLIAQSGSVVGVVVDGTVFSDWSEYEEDVIDPYFSVHNEIPEGAFDEDEFNELLEVAPYQWGSEGPMMNYWYPVNESLSHYGYGFDPKEAAAKLKDLPLCVVEVDGEYGLALTGGGMDLSWEICEAYIALNMLPPAHFADLPRMADRWTEGKQRVLDAMRRTLTVEIEVGQRRLERLDHTREWFRQYEESR